MNALIVPAPTHRFAQTPWFWIREVVVARLQGVSRLRSLVLPEIWPQQINAIPRTGVWSGLPRPYQLAITLWLIRAGHRADTYRAMKALNVIKRRHTNSHVQPNVPSTALHLVCSKDASFSIEKLAQLGERVAHDDARGHALLTSMLSAPESK